MLAVEPPTAAFPEVAPPVPATYAIEEGLSAVVFPAPVMFPETLGTIGGAGAGGQEAQLEAAVPPELKTVPPGEDEGAPAEVDSLPFVEAALPIPPHPDSPTPTSPTRSQDVASFAMVVPPRTT
jgi:hypothetical protein